MYTQLERGQIKIAFTRVQSEKVIGGYYERSGGVSNHKTNLNSKYIPLFKQIIRGGGRPEIDVYWSPLVPNGGGYVCADDENTLSAYNDLGFKLIPCRILKPKNLKAQEGAIWAEKADQDIALAKTVPPILEKYSSFFGNKFPDFSTVINRLKRECGETRKVIISFHQDFGTGSHYHQMLHTLIVRHERVLDSILRLVVLNRVEHASALTRIAYEAFLNFYIDWLSPEFFGPRLQLLARVRGAQASSDRSLDSHLSVLGNFVDFLENTHHKARISPLGLYFHESIYPELSLVAHQSYRHLEYEAEGFNESDPGPLSSTTQLGRWLDILTAELLIRVRNDVGAIPHISSS
ncbi:hypothetical protein HLI18_14485 [Rhizobium laguerreae]|nr:hypothetical protein [Rhizobium laguerreae]NNG71115.1 hypothetical protein [Rhizobium laguerreae]